MMTEEEHEEAIRNEMIAKMPEDDIHFMMKSMLLKNVAYMIFVLGVDDYKIYNLGFYNSEFPPQDGFNRRSMYRVSASCSVKLFYLDNIRITLERKGPDEYEWFFVYTEVFETEVNEKVKVVCSNYDFERGFHKFLNKVVQNLQSMLDVKEQVELRKNQFEELCKTFE